MVNHIADAKKQVASIVAFVIMFTFIALTFPFATLLPQDTSFSL